MNSSSSDDSSNISCKKRRALPPDGVGAKKCQRLDEYMIGKNLPTAEELADETYSSSSELDEPDADINHCEAATEESSSLSIIDNIFPSSFSSQQHLIQQRPRIQSNDAEAAAQLRETISIPITPSSPTAAAAAAAALRCNKKSMVLSPNDFFKAELRSRGYPATTFCSLKGGYHSTPTKHQLSSYGISLTRAIRSSDKLQLRTLLSTGLNPNACNKFGESIIHAVCRRGDHDMLRVLLDAGSSVQVSDDFGRTPLHDACWTASPKFETVSLLLEKDPWLLSMTDCRGNTPLGYVRKAHWAVWNGFLGAIIDRYWPPCTDDSCDANYLKCEQTQQQYNDQHGITPKIPPLSLLAPDSSPVIDPPQGRIKRLDLLELLANGMIDPQDLDENADTIMKDNLKQVEVNRRITIDPQRCKGSNATVMVGSVSVVQGYVRVSTPV